MTTSKSPPENWYSAIMQTSDAEHQHHIKARSDLIARKIASEWFVRKVQQRFAKRRTCTVHNYELHGLSGRIFPTITISPVSDFRPEVIDGARINLADFTFYAFTSGEKESP